MAIAALIATTGLALHVAQAQQVGARRIDLQRHDLSVAGREVIQTIVELAPGTTAPRHTHPGEEIIYVLEGTWEYTVEGKPPVILKAGDVLFIPAGTIHSARNVGTGRAAELATYIVEKGEAAPHAGEVTRSAEEGSGEEVVLGNEIAHLNDGRVTRPLGTLFCLPSQCDVAERLSIWSSVVRPTPERAESVTRRHRRGHNLLTRRPKRR